MIKLLIADVDGTAPVAAFNGGMYVRSDLTTVLMQRTIAPAVAAPRALGVDPEEAVTFEDAPAGVAARKAGHLGYVVAIDRAGRGDELRRQSADDVVTDIAALLEPVAS